MQVAKFQTLPKVLPIGLNKVEAPIFEGKQGDPIGMYAEKGVKGQTDSGYAVGEKYAKHLITAYLAQSLKLIGIKAENFPEKAIGKTIVDYIYRNHAWIRPVEILKSFEYAVSLDDKQQDPKRKILDHYQAVGVQMISRVLNLYREHSEAHEREIIKKYQWFENSMSSWVEARAKDNEAVSSAYLKTLNEHKEGSDYTYLVLFPAFYDWLDFLGLIDMTAEEKKLISWRVKAMRVDSYRPVMDRIKIDSLFNHGNIIDACKRAAFMELLNKWDGNAPIDFIDKCCYIAPNAFEQLHEIILQRKELGK